MKNAASQYLREVDRRLVCPSALKRPFLRQLKQELQCCCGEGESSDLQALSRRFGTPEELAENFFSELNGRTVDRCACGRRRILCLALAVLLTAAVVLSILQVRELRAQQELLDDDFIASITYEKDSGRQQEAVVKSTSSHK